MPADKYKNRKQRVSNGFTLRAIVVAIVATTTLGAFEVLGENLTPNSNTINRHDSHKGDDDNEIHQHQHSDRVLLEPVFDFGMPNNITVRSGQSALIKCRVDHLGDKSVSWIRKRDLHILTVDTSTYTSDQRFQVAQTTDSRDWLLQVKFAQPRDSGIYECQINTEPKISMAFRLNVIEIPTHHTASIIGPPDLHFKVGSVIILTCLVKQPKNTTVGPIQWYREDRLLTLFNDELEDDEENSSKPVNQIENDIISRIALESQLSDRLKSRLRIANAQKSDTGNYTCLPATARSASVMVHVINDEKPAAMQKSAAKVATFKFVIFPPSLFILFYLKNIRNYIA